MNTAEIFTKFITANVCQKGCGVIYCASVPCLNVLFIKNSNQLVVQTHGKLVMQNNLHI